ncbi:hypothetical protein KKD03_04610 [Patescibacteria group bacterium]|nr:hypothetical protein [Patescibacteria group bacterium]
MNRSWKESNRTHYDKAEDRANDVRTHDNPNHPSKHANDKVKTTAMEMEMEREDNL